MLKSKGSMEETKRTTQGTRSFSSPAEKTIKEMERELAGAVRELLRSLREEPPVVILSGQPGSEADCPVEEIASWLFRRRQDSGGAAN